MTYLPFLSSLKQPQCKDQTIMEPDRSVRRLEMASLTGSLTAEKRTRKVLRSSQPPLLYIAGCLLVTSLVLVLSLAVLALHIFSPAASSSSQDSDLFNVLLVGGRGEDNSSLVSVELLNIGGCPAQTSSDLLIPSLPLPLSSLTVSPLSHANSITVCGADSQDDWRCFTLTNSSSTWQTSPVEPYTGSGKEYTEGGEGGEALQLSHRHGASLLTLPDRLLLLGGRR